MNEEEANTNNQALSEQPFIVKSLDIRFSNLTLSGIKRLCMSLKRNWSAVSELDFVQCRLNDECLDCISELVSRKLTELMLFNNDEITDVGVASLSRALQDTSCKITKLSLDDNQVTDAGAASLCQALKEPSCNVCILSLSNNQITDAGVKSLSQVLKEPNCKVTTLDLRHNQITGVGVSSLCEALTQPSCNVARLRLDCNRISDAGAINVCEAIKQQSFKVTELYLGGNQITVAGIVRLCQAITEAPSSNLAELDISENANVSDQLKKSLENMLQKHRPDIIVLL